MKRLCWSRKYFWKKHRKELLTKIIDQVKPEDLKAAGITLTIYIDEKKIFIRSYMFSC